MSGTKKRGGLGLDDFKPKMKTGDAAEVKKADEIAHEHGFTSRENNSVQVEPTKRPPGRPPRKQPRKQLNFVANLPDIEWFSERREEMGVNGAKLFSDMRAAYEKEINSNK